jgi:hypothetical protein
MVMATSAALTCSPVEASESISRMSGVELRDALHAL